MLKNVHYLRRDMLFLQLLSCRKFSISLASVAPISAISPCRHDQTSEHASHTGYKQRRMTV